MRRNRQKAKHVLWHTGQCTPACLISENEVCYILSGIWYFTMVDKIIKIALCEVAVLSEIFSVTSSLPLMPLEKPVRTRFDEAFPDNRKFPCRCKLLVS